MTSQVCAMLPWGKSTREHQPHHENHEKTVLIMLKFSKRLSTIEIEITQSSAKSPFSTLNTAPVANPANNTHQPLCPNAYTSSIRPQPLH